MKAKLIKDYANFMSRCVELCAENEEEKSLLGEICSQVSGGSVGPLNSYSLGVPNAEEKSPDIGRKELVGNWIYYRIKTNRELFGYTFQRVFVHREKGPLIGVNDDKLLPSINGKADPLYFLKWVHVDEIEIVHIEAE